MTAWRPDSQQARLDVPNLRKLFAASRTEEEERTYSRTAFYNLLLFFTSVATFSFIAQHVGRVSQLKSGSS